MASRRARIRNPEMRAQAYGRHLEIENPDEFIAWLGIKHSWWRRLLARVGNRR